MIIISLKTLSYCFESSLKSRCDMILRQNVFHRPTKWPDGAADVTTETVPAGESPITKC